MLAGNYGFIWPDLLCGGDAIVEKIKEPATLTELMVIALTGQILTNMFAAETPGVAPMASRERSVGTAALKQPMLLAQLPCMRQILRTVQAGAVPACLHVSLEALWPCQ